MTGLLEGLAAYGLPGARAYLPDLDPVTFARLLAGARKHRLQGLLARLANDGHITLTGFQRDRIRELHLEALLHVMSIERELLSVAEILDGEGIDLRPLKGPALARVAYRDPSERVFGDLDLLVAGADLGHAVRLLEAVGYRRRMPALREAFDERFAKSVTLVSQDGIEVDLHRSLVPGPFGVTIDLESLFDGRTRFEIAGVTFHTLSAAHLLLHACYVASVGDVPARFIVLRDVAELVLAQAADPALVIQEARRWNGEALLARGICLAWDTFRLEDVVALSTWARRFRPGRTDRRRLASYARAGYAVTALETTLAIRGVRPRLAYLRAVLFPDRRFLDAAAENGGSWLQRGTRSLWDHHDRIRDDAEPVSGGAA